MDNFRVYKKLQKSISRVTSKLIALISMIIDHIGHAILVPYINTNASILVLYCVLRSIGRIAFPLYAFMLAEGMYYTHNLKNMFAGYGSLPSCQNFHMIT